MDAELRTIFACLASRCDLSREQTRWVFERMMQGTLDPAVTAALCGAFVTKGESVDELVGAAEAMRACAVPIRCDRECLDTCGTGGDGISTFNVSTTAAIIAAAAGATVAKHGNRSTSRVSGSSEVLEALGVDIDAPPPVVERCLRKVRIGYLNARTLHPAMIHAAPVRRAIPGRTIFNLLGPLTNPAGARRQVLGVPTPALLDLVSGALVKLGAVHAWVVHGADGLCDLTTGAETTVVEVRDGRLARFTVRPEEVGLNRADRAALTVSSAGQSAEVVRSILDGVSGPARDLALLNAGAALVVADLASDLSRGVRLAAAAVDGGAARDTLEKWRSIASESTDGRNPTEGAV